jgi:hypothetical protein
MGFRAAVSYPQPGLDNSYAFALNYAAVHGERWGREFLADRGPYGWLLFPVDVGDVTRSWFLAQALLVLMLGSAVAAYVWSLPGSVARRILTALFLTYAIHLAFWDEYRWFALFLLLLLLGLHGKGRRGLIAFGMASVLAGFYLLLKLTIGPGALLTLATVVVLQRRPSSVLTRIAVASSGATLGLLAGWLVCYGSLSGLGTYLAVGLSMVAGYSSVASRGIEGWQLVAGSFLGFFLLLGAWCIFLRHRRARLSLAGCAVPLFVAWKHSLVRPDVHGRLLVLFGLFIVAVLFTDSLTAERRWRASPILVGAVVSLVAAWFHLPADKDTPVRTLAKALAQPLHLPGVTGLRALVRLPQYRASLGQLSSRALEPLVLSAAERGVLGDSTVDVYPWEASYVAANHLNWAHRPSPASFLAFPTLDRLNAAFFNSSRRPQYLLWHLTAGLQSIDGRHMFWDEPHTLLSILSHYDLLSPGGTVFILVTRANPRSVSRRFLGTVTVPWGDSTPVPDAGGVTLAEVELHRPWAAWLRRLALREEEMWLETTLTSGSTLQHRFVPDQVGSGLWISQLPISPNHLVALFEGRIRQRGKVATIRFQGGWANGPPLRISWWRLDIGPGEHEQESNARGHSPDD